jgi:hypothetical protein
VLAQVPVTHLYKGKLPICIHGAVAQTGEYSLVNLTFSCFDNSWHTLSGDHTPSDAGGYYMLVNSEATDGTFFLHTVSGLCPQYNLSVFGMGEEPAAPYGL